MISFTEDDAIDALNFALEKFETFDKAELNRCKFGERVITHRLGLYLSEYFERKEAYKKEKIRVDCEYNRKGKNEPKRGFGPHISEKLRELIFAAKKRVTQIEQELFPEALKNEVEDLLIEKKEAISAEKLQNFLIAMHKWDEVAGSLLNPDIVVHTRGICDNNLLVIEAKKGYAADHKVQYDKKKLGYFVSELQVEEESDKPSIESGLGYRFGFFLHFDDHGDLTEARLYTDAKEDDDILHRLKQGSSCRGQAGRSI